MPTEDKRSPNVLTLCLLFPSSRCGGPGTDGSQRPVLSSSSNGAAFELPNAVPPSRCIPPLTEPSRYSARCASIRPSVEVGAAARSCWRSYPQRRMGVTATLVRDPRSGAVFPATGDQGPSCIVDCSLARGPGRWLSTMSRHATLRVEVSSWPTGMHRDRQVWLPCARRVG